MIASNLGLGDELLKLYLMLHTMPEEKLLADGSKSANLMSYAINLILIYTKGKPKNYKRMHYNILMPNNTIFTDLP